MLNISKVDYSETIDKIELIVYNVVNLKCTTTLVILNLHHFKRDSYIA